MRCIHDLFTYWMCDCMPPSIYIHACVQDAGIRHTITMQHDCSDKGGKRDSTFVMLLLCSFCDLALLWRWSCFVPSLLLFPCLCLLFFYSLFGLFSSLLFVALLCFAVVLSPFLSTTYRSEKLDLHLLALARPQA